VVPQARSSAMAPAVEEVRAKNEVELLDPRVAASQFGGVRFAPGGERALPRQG